MRTDRMNRRQLLGQMTRLFGVAFATPLANGVLAGAVGASMPETGNGKALDRSEATFVAAIADLIIPRTDTPSASEAGVVGFVDRIVGEFETESGRRKFKRGLKAFYAMADRELGGCFISGRKGRQEQWLAAFDRRAFSGKAGAERSFYRGLKKLIVTGYYVSEPGASEELAYLDVPGPYQGDIPVTEETRAWAN